MKKTTKRRRSPTTSAAMAPGRVMAPTPETTKKMLEPTEAGTARVTRQKAAEIAETNQRESQLQRDEGFESMNEETTVLMDLSHNAPTREQLQLMQDEGKFIF